ALAESILPDARDLAGPQGELVLVRDAVRRRYARPGASYDRPNLEEAEDYLEILAERLRAEGHPGGTGVQTHALVINDVALAIDEAARIFHANFIACATHGHGPLGRLVHGGVAWRAVAHSPVPVLLRHPEDRPRPRSLVPGPRRILVPLDGSRYAERALPVARQLTAEWDASLWLVQIIPELRPPSDPAIPLTGTEERLARDVRAAGEYLRSISADLPGEVHLLSCTGGVVDALVEIARASAIGHIVLASQGRTPLQRVILGSVADSLIQRLHCPIVVVPPSSRSWAGRSTSRTWWAWGSISATSSSQWAANPSPPSRCNWTRPLGSIGPSRSSSSGRRPHGTGGSGPRWSGTSVPPWPASRRATRPPSVRERWTRSGEGPQARGSRARRGRRATSTAEGSRGRRRTPRGSRVLARAVQAGWRRTEGSKRARRRGNDRHPAPPEVSSSSGTGVRSDREPLDRQAGRRPSRPGADNRLSTDCQTRAQDHQDRPGSSHPGVGPGGVDQAAGRYGMVNT
ncbi:MAG: universal stress protein, partial [Chloroflexi bacterium]|nr:universal stress protein [Chloroflexota bacterium]